MEQPGLRATLRRAGHVTCGQWCHEYRAGGARVSARGGAATTIIGFALALLPGALRPPYVVLLMLWALNGGGQAMIAVASVRQLADHTAADERGRVYAAHFALTHLCWLVTYPAVGLLSRSIGVPRMFSLAGGVALLMTVIAAGIRPTPRHGRAALA